MDTYSPETQRVMDLFDATEISPNIPIATSGNAEGGPDDIAYTAGGISGTKKELAEWREQGGIMSGGTRRRRRSTHRRRGHKKSKSRSHRRLRRTK